MAAYPDQVSRIERSHGMLRECIAEAKRLCEKAQQLVRKHRQVADAADANG